MILGIFWFKIKFMKNYYAILGLPLTASAEDIKIAYRQNAKKYHPDMNEGSEAYKQRYLEINEAYDILSVPEKKKEYDDKVAAYKRARAAQAAQQQQQQQAQQQQSHRQAQPPPQGSAYRYQYQPPRPEPAQQPQKQAAPEQRRHSESSADSVSLSAVKIYNDKKMREVKKTYALQVEVIRKNSKKEIKELKARLLAQIDAHKKQSDIRSKKLAAEYKHEIEKARKEAKHYKENYKKSSFNAGVELGLKEAYADSKKTIKELKGIVDTVNTDMEKLRAEKHKLEQRYIEAKKNDDGVNADDLIKIHREKMEIETEFAKTKTILRGLELKLAHAEDECRRLESEADVLRSNAENAAKQSEKQKKALEENLAKAREEIKELEDDITGMDATLEEKEREIEKLKKEVSELRRRDKVFGRAKTEEAEESAETESYRGQQRELAKGTLYELLGVSLNALPDEIEQAFDTISKRLKGKKDFIELYIKVIEAYNVLSNEDSKAEYDESINNTTELF